jgi:hypothetical protein
VLSELERIFYSEVHNICQKWAHYFEIYEKHLSRFRSRPVRLLDVGVSQGGSLDLWRRYFGPEALLFGLDVDPACRRFEAPNTRIIIGSQDDRAFLSALAAELEHVDIIIDDGGHTMDQQKNTFDLLFPIVQPDGIYLCEDVHTSYQESYGGGLRVPNSFLEAIKMKVDELHAAHPGGPTQTEFSSTTNSITFYDSVIVVEKRRKEAPRAVEVGRHMAVRLEGA